MACLSKLQLALMGAAVSGLIIGLSPAVAQDSIPDSNTGTASTLNPNQGFPSAEGGDLFSDPMGPMELIHRAVLMNNMSLIEFRQQQQQRISDEATNFRQMQQEALRRTATPEADPTN
jgi:hypothetical protein